jgi:hypothetical protein
MADILKGFYGIYAFVFVMRHGFSSQKSRNRANHSPPPPRFLYGEITKDDECIKSQGVMIIPDFSSVFIRVYPWFEFFPSQVVPAPFCGFYLPLSGVNLPP